MVGTGVLCNFGDTRIAQHPESVQYLPISTTEKTLPFGSWRFMARDERIVSQPQVDSESWIVAVATELGADWQRGMMLDFVSTPARRERGR